MNLNQDLQQAIELGKNSKSKAQFFKAFVTPELASAILALQIEKEFKNRKLREHYVEKGRRQILCGRFNEDTRSVKLSPRFRIVDGQHILNSIVRANKGVYIRLGLNVPETVLDNIDTNQKRTFGQTQEILGGLTKRETHTANALMELKIVSTSLTQVAFDGKSPSLEEDKDKVEFFLKFEKIVNTIRELNSRQVNTAGYLMGFLTWAYSRYPDEVNRAVQFIESGDPKGDPVLKSFLSFRDWMCRENLGNGSARKGLVRGVFKMILALHSGEPVGSRWLNSTTKDQSTEEIQALIRQCAPLQIVKPNAGGLTIRRSGGFASLGLSQVTEYPVQA